jgi:hypothetical protein
MWWYDPDAASREGECNYLREFRQIATESILAHITETTTPEQHQLVLDSLLELKDELIGRVDAFHRSPLYGRHRCLENEYSALRLKLLNAMVLKPVPQPAPEPPPPAPQPQMTLEDVVKAFGEPVQPYDDATYIGSDEDEQDGW